MSQAVNKRKIVGLVVTILCILSLGVAVFAGYLNTNRDTRKAPKKATEKLSIKDKAYEKIYQTDKYEYYFRDDRDIIAIKDKNNGYVWKTGLDAAFSSQIRDCKDAVKEGRVKEYAEEEEMDPAEVKTIANTPQEDSLNSQFTAMANSLLTIEYYSGEDEGMTTTRTSSASEKKKDGMSTLSKVSGEEGKFQLKCTFGIDDEKLMLNAYITFTKDGKIKYDIPRKEMTDSNKGKVKSKIKNVVITPFLGASGGAIKVYNKSTDDWDKIETKKLTPGYVMVPDGSGALMRFNENKAKFTDYEGDVYGTDPATDMYYHSEKNDAVEVKQPSMPVYGISHGDGTQAAFVAYATKGDEYMSINVVPASTEKNKIKYTYAYPAFKYNAEYFQVKDQAGNSYRKVQDKMNKFDISVTYEFLSGDGKDGSPSADYVGMAKAYRNQLIKTKTLKEKKSNSSNIPIRIDFLMSDSKKGVFSTQEVPVTTADNVKSILNELLKDNVKNINSGLIGWQSKGETLAKPNSTSFSGDIGSEGDFEDLMSYFNKKKVDVSYSRDFSSINEDMTGYYGVAARHLSTRYIEVDKTAILPQNVPVTEYGYASPETSDEWLNDLFDDVGEDGKSFTIDGISDTLVSTYDSDDDSTSVTQAIKMYQKSCKNIKKNKVKLNMVNPNQYLWKYTDRYLQSSVGTSQYVYETDTVPFLQMVLNGTMEVYAPYSNFSFYSKSDMLKMIDYNISPSFVLTKKPSYLLAATTSSDYYSTEYSQYEKIINTIYDTVNGTLKDVQGYSWTDRKVLDDGVIANTYKKDNETKTVVINYTEDDVTVKGQKIEKLSAKTLEGGVK